MAKSSIGWLVGYLAMLCAVAWAVTTARSWALSELSRPEARAAWEEYKESARHEAEVGGPVQRKIPTAAEPPVLIMLRDRFWAVMAAGLIFASLFYGFGMFVARGLRQSSTAQRLPDTSGPP